MAHERTYSESDDDNANFVLLAKRADNVGGLGFVNLNDEINSDSSTSGDQNTLGSMEWETTMPEVSTNNSIAHTETLYSQSIQPESDTLIQYSGNIVLVDSPIMHHALELLRVRLLQIGLNCQVKLYPNEQGRDQCGYISICSVFNLRKPDWEIELSKPLLFNTPDKVIKLFNAMIDLHGCTGAIRLSNNHICEIVRNIEFLVVNFHLAHIDMHQLTRIDATAKLFQKVRELRNSLADASIEVGNLQSVNSFRIIVGSIKQLLRYCLERAKNGNFKFLLQGIMNLIKSGRADYKEISKRFQCAVDKFTTGNWFAGVFTFEEFLRHIQEEIRATDRDSVVTKCAIVNTTERPGEHWFAVGYEIRRHVATLKATDG